MLTINSTTRFGRPSLNVPFNFLVNENKFSVPVERHRFSKSHDITLQASSHCHDKYHYEKFKHMIVMIIWSGNATNGRKTISVLNHINLH